MRRLSHLSLHLSLGLSAIGMMAAPVLAQDLGTYRPGQAYQSVSSSGADVCNSHCAGDAQCRAWNYVKVNPKGAGVCEFLASASAPVHSPISISGENISQQSYSRPLSQGGTNTVRVGTATKSAQNTATITQTPTRRIVREAVPQGITPQRTSYHASTRQVPNSTLGQAQGLSLTEQQNQYRRQTGEFRPAVDPRATSQRQVDPRLQDPRLAALRQQNLQQAPQNIGQPYGRPQSAPFQPLLDGQTRHAPRKTVPFSGPQNPNVLRQQLRQNQAQGFQGQAFQGQGFQPNPVQSRRQAEARPPIGQPIGPVSDSIAQQAARLQPRPQQSAQANRAQDLPRASANSPVTAQNAREAFARRQADLAAIASGNSVDPIQQSLYGTLNDDVKVRAQLKTLPSDPDAPIATSASRPVAPVETQPLNQLAGGPR